jgi:16S rRNA C1402 (ribose-2'-O) methylase RsmI
MGCNMTDTGMEDVIDAMRGGPIETRGKFFQKYVHNHELIPAETVYRPTSLPGKLLATLADDKAHTVPELTHVVNRARSGVQDALTALVKAGLVKREWYTTLADGGHYEYKQL